MNLKQLEYVAAIAEEGNISHAAERLKVTQSTMSQGLLNLEQELGMPLFERSNRGMRLTKAGEACVQGAREILHICGRIQMEIESMNPKNKKSYTIGISSQRGFDLFSEGYHRFKEKHSDVEVRVVEENASELLEGLREDRYSMILTAADSFEKIEFPYQTLSKEEILLVAPADREKDILSKHGNLRMDLLKYEKFILANRGTTMRATTNHLFSALGYHPNIVCETGHTQALTKMVSKGIGFAVLPETLRMQTDNVAWLSFYPKFYRRQVAIYQEKYAEDGILMNLIKVMKM